MIGQIILNHGLNVAKPLAEPPILGFRTLGQLVRASPVDTKNLGGFGQNGLFRWGKMMMFADFCQGMEKGSKFWIQKRSVVKPAPQTSLGDGWEHHKNWDGWRKWNGTEVLTGKNLKGLCKTLEFTPLYKQKQ